MADTHSPAVPAPASRSGEDHAAAKVVANDVAESRRWATGIRNLARCYLAYAELLSRDSGEAVKPMILWLRKEAAEWQPADPDWQSPVGNKLSETADLIEALSASAARLTEDNKRLREALEQIDRT